MEQTNMVLSALQSMAAQNMVPKTGKTGKATDDFQKLLDQKSQASTKGDTPVEQKPKPDAAVKEEGPVQDDPLEQVKKLAEQGVHADSVQRGSGPLRPQQRNPRSN